MLASNTTWSSLNLEVKIKSYIRLSALLSVEGIVDAFALSAADFASADGLSNAGAGAAAATAD